jgi:hypothetical protein
MIITNVNRTKRNKVLDDGPGGGYLTHVDCDAFLTRLSDRPEHRLCSFALFMY